ncbi:outer membrane beta-barrel protein [Aliivibrio sp. S2TY2]|uniref:outer membrane beta-barrel protein n=1 Tax=unclassified Aliivibrio TaxID=2645654 RepID=UPI0023790758|nr:MULTISPECIES: outer membrane beta-barrel protein [unclassified Aliivibrio]MDD9173501.1 outer membrane beta-barrel protein [Aliivibrio sp. S3TY1]MDD9190577.1 outer membrane beta-barrel protein [Aliivibrio sp. S2TY2]
MNRNLILLFSIFTVNTVQANNDNSIGVDLGYGSIKNDISSGILNGTSNNDDMATINIFYRYMVNTSYGVELGYRNSFGGFGSMLTSDFKGVRDLEFYGPKINFYSEKSINNLVGIYGKLGINYYTTEYVLNNEKKEISYSELGTEASLGINLSFDGLGFGIEYNYILSESLNSGSILLSSRFKF